MVSLTTVYLVSVILTSIAGIGSAFAGDKMSGGSSQIPTEVPPVSVQTPIEEAQSISSETPLEELPPVSSIEQNQPEVPSESS